MSVVNRQKAFLIEIAHKLDRGEELTLFERKFHIAFLKKGGGWKEAKIPAGRPSNLPCDLAIWYGLKLQAGFTKNSAVEALADKYDVDREQVKIALGFKAKNKDDILKGERLKSTEKDLSQFFPKI